MNNKKHARAEADKKLSPLGQRKADADEASRNAPPPRKVGKPTVKAITSASEAKHLRPARPPLHQKRR